MNPSKLVKSWSAPKVPKMARQQICIRLPIPVQARIEALVELYSDTGRTRTDVVGDLLSFAIDAVEADLLASRPMTDEEIELQEQVTGRSMYPDEDKTIFRYGQLSYDYEHLVNARTKVLESEYNQQEEAAQ